MALLKDYLKMTIQMNRLSSQQCLAKAIGSGLEWYALNRSSYGHHPQVNIENIENSHRKQVYTGNKMSDKI